MSERRICFKLVVSTGKFPGKKKIIKDDLRIIPNLFDQYKYIIYLKIKLIKN